MSFVGFTDQIQITFSDHWKSSNPLNLGPGDVLTLNKVPSPTYNPVPDVNCLVYTEDGTETASITNRIKMSFGNANNTLFSVGFSRMFPYSPVSIMPYIFYNMARRVSIFQSSMFPAKASPYSFKDIWNHNFDLSRDPSKCLDLLTSPTSVLFMPYQSLISALEAVTPSSLSIYVDGSLIVNGSTTPIYFQYDETKTITIDYSETLTINHVTVPDGFVVTKTNGDPLPDGTTFIGGGSFLIKNEGQGCGLIDINNTVENFTFTICSSVINVSYKWNDTHPALLANIFRINAESTITSVEWDFLSLDEHAEYQSYLTFSVDSNGIIGNTDDYQYFVGGDLSYIELYLPPFMELAVRFRQIGGSDESWSDYVVVQTKQYTSFEEASILSGECPPEVAIEETETGAEITVPEPTNIVITSEGATVYSRTDSNIEYTDSGATIISPVIHKECET